MEDRSKSRNPAAARGKCFHCNELGHWKRDCPKLKGTWKNHGKQNEASSSMVAESGADEDKAEVLIVTTGADQDKWVMDSGCTYHMTPEKAYFTSLRQAEGSVMIQKKLKQS